jgi:hypothetical protein
MFTDPISTTLDAVSVDLKRINQDNNGSTYFARIAEDDPIPASDVTMRIAHSEEGKTSDRKERHRVDVTRTYFPTDGSPSYTVQAYCHMIHPKGLETAELLDLATSLTTFVAAEADDLIDREV